jgi:hypothetical protein
MRSFLQYSQSPSAASDCGSQEVCIFDTTDVNAYLEDYFAGIFTSDLEFGICKTKLDSHIDILRELGAYTKGSRRDSSIGSSPLSTPRKQKCVKQKILETIKRNRPVISPLNDSCGIRARVPRFCWNARQGDCQWQSLLRISGALNQKGKVPYR